MKKVLCILLLVVPFVCAAHTATQAEAGGAPALRYDNAAGVVVRTQQGSAAFSWNRLAASLPFRYGGVAVTGGSATLLSGFSGATAEVLFRHGHAAVEAGTEETMCAVGLRAGLTEWELNRLRIRLPNTAIYEKSVLDRFYTAGISCGLPAYQMRYDGNRYWGRLSFGLHDLGVVIAQPSADFVISTHTFRLTQCYECSIATFKLQGILTNKHGESITSGAAQAFVFQNTVYVPIAAHSVLSLFASYISFSGLFSIRLTAANQGYFLFPYRFYNRDMSISGSALGFCGSYRYTADRFRFYGTVQFYSVVNDAGSDVLHSKEKKSFLFKGKEERSASPLPSITGTSILRQGHTNQSDALPKEQLTQSVLIIDPLLTGLSVRLTIRL